MVEDRQKMQGVFTDGVSATPSDICVPLPPSEDTPVSDADVIQDILPRHEVSILAGPSGGGKSTLLMQFLAAFQRGDAEFLGHRLDPDTRWGYLANDHAWKMYLGTAHRCGLDLSQIPHISLFDDREINLEDFKVNSLRTLEDCLGRLRDQGCTAIVADTLVSWFGGDPRNYNTAAYALVRLGRWCMDNKITLLGTHHATKARTDFTFKRAQDRISGSASLLGFSSTQLCLLPPEETGNESACYEFHVVSHNAPAKMIPLTRGANTGVFEPFNADGLTLMGESLTELEADIMNVFYASSDPGMSFTRQYVKAALPEHIPAASLDRALKRLVRAALLRKVKHGEYTAPLAS